MKLQTGYKLLVRKDDGKTWHKAEILSIRFEDNPEDNPENTQYYVHFDGYNKRLDEWVAHSRLDLKSVELPKPIEPVTKPSSTPSTSNKAAQKRKRQSEKVAPA
jgi:histone acetyltransferase HTATIP